MHTYKLTLKTPDGSFDLITRMVRAEDETEAREIATNSVLNDNIWLDRERTSCEIVNHWRDQPDGTEKS